jgi:hypothetical protein
MAGPNLLSTLALFGGGEPAPDPLPSLDLPNVADQQMGLSPGLPAPMPAAPTAPRRGGLDMVRDLAPIIMAVVAGRKNPLHGAAIANGMATGALAAQREQMAAQQHDEELRRLGSEFMRQTAADVMRLKDPLERQQYLDFAEQIGVQQFKLPPQWTKRVPAHHAGDDLFAKLKGELAEKLKAFDSDKKWSTVAGTPQEAKISFRLSNGQSVPVSKARQLIGQAVYDASGNQAFAPMPDTSEAPENKTDYSRFLTRYAKQLGKASANELTAAEELAAKKAYGQADDKGADPVLAAIRQLTLSNLQRNSGADVTPGQATVGGKLADDFRMESKDFIQTSQAYNRVKASAQDPSAAGDLALIFNYMKTLDPGSTVREGEFATAQNAGGAGERIVAMYNKVLNGERLSSAQRADFLDRSRRLYAQALKQHQRVVEQYRRKARSVGVPEDFVITDYSDPEERASGTSGGGPSKATLRYNPVTRKMEPITR